MELKYSSLRRHRLLLSVAVSFLWYANSIVGVPSLAIPTYQGRIVSQSEVLFNVKPADALLCQVSLNSSTKELTCPWRRGIQQEDLCNASSSPFSKLQPTASPSSIETVYQLVFDHRLSSGVYQCGMPSSYVAFYIINGKSTR
eukprot:scpid106680/ scgid3114/ 